MNEAERSRDLLNMAVKDFNVLKAMGNNPAFADEIFGFHAQQAGEKALKAWIASLGCDFPLTHNIVALLAILEEQKVDVKLLRLAGLYSRRIAIYD